MLPVSGALRSLAARPTRAVSCALACALVCALASCGPPTVGLRLRFPSLQTFLVSATARVEIYEGGDDPDAICRTLSVGQPAGVQPLQATGAQDVCAFVEGTEIPAVSTGRLVVFVEAEDAIGTKLLRGCRVVAVDGKPDPRLSPEERDEAAARGVVSFVEVQLATLPTYPADAEPRCVSIEEKCERLIPCTP